MISYIKYFFYLILIIVSIIFFFSSDYEVDNVVQKENLEPENIGANDSLNIIENINYSSLDKDGNKYLITAETGEIYQNNFNNIKMKYVSAKIIFLNQEYLEIKSNYANYNRETSETLFYNEVLSSYLDNKISSNKLQLLFDDKLAKIKDNVVYMSKQGKLEADEVLLDLRTKKAKISMNNSEEKIKISYLN
tara:strand:+ start:1009 stop:1584 length:576 start_codon:yes stop_codon:yes gene_type:complete